MQNIEKEAAKLVLGTKDESDKFWIEFLGFKIPLSIPLQTAKQVVKTSYYGSLMSEIDEQGELFPELIKNSKNINLQCKAIAVATRSKIPFLWRIIRAKATLSEINTMYKMVRVKSDPEAFFFTMGLVKGMNKFRKKDPEK